MGAYVYICICIYIYMGLAKIIAAQDRTGS